MYPCTLWHMSWSSLFSLSHHSLPLYLTLILLPSNELGLRLSRNCPRTLEGKEAKTKTLGIDNMWNNVSIFTSSWKTSGSFAWSLCTTGRQAGERDTYRERGCNSTWDSLFQSFQDPFPFSPIITEYRNYICWNQHIDRCDFFSMLRGCSSYTSSHSPSIQIKLPIRHVLLLFAKPPPCLMLPSHSRLHVWSLISVIPDRSSFHPIV